MSDRITVHIRHPESGMKVSVTGNERNMGTRITASETEIDASLEEQAQEITASVNMQARSVGTRVDKRACPHTPYLGGYEFTPEATEQVIATRGLVLSDDIRIAPIPSNYGLVTFNGRIITVS